MYEFLTSFGRKAWQFIERGVRENLSFKEVFEALRTEYPKYEEPKAYTDFQRITQYVDRWKELDTIPEDEAWGRDYYAPTYRPTAGRYNMSFQIKVYNPETGEYTTQYMSAKSDILRVKREWKDEIEHIWEVGKEDYNDPREIVDIKPTKAWRGW